MGGWKEGMRRDVFGRQSTIPIGPCKCVCVCVCEREREEGGRSGMRRRVREVNNGTHRTLIYVSVLVCVKERKRGIENEKREREREREREERERQGE